jgi:hypothetical protein
MIFAPIYIAKYAVFSKLKKYNDFASVAVDFAMLNILLIVINGYTVTNRYASSWWFFGVALPIVLGVYLVLNLLLSVRFLKTNRFLKTSILLFLIDLFVYLPPLLIKVKNPAFQRELDSANVFLADLSSWKVDATLENNIHLIICLTLLLLAAVFCVVGLICRSRGKRKSKA